MPIGAAVWDMNQHSYASDTEQEINRDIPVSSSSGQRETINESTISPSVERSRPGRKQTKKKKQQQEITFEPIRKRYSGVSPEEDFGDSFGEKSDGIIRLAGGNFNGFNLSNFNNEKGNKVCQFCRIFDVDAFFGQESNVDCT
jgi:hypothetical protein